MMNDPNEYKEWLDEEKKVLDQEYEERFNAIRKLKKIAAKGTMEEKVAALMAHTIDCLQRDMEDIQKESMQNVDEKTSDDDDGDGMPDDPEFS